MSREPIYYLDHAAATPVDPDVLAAMQPYFSEQFYNPSATYLPAVEVRKAIEAARGRVAHWLGARPSEIVFTAGGTEANNLAVRGVMSRFPDGNVVVSAIEHDSVLAPSAEYERRVARVAADGRVDLEDLAKKIDGLTVLVSIGYANNEIGTVQPIKDIAKLIDQKRQGRQRPLYFHTDAAQAGNYLDMHVSRLGVDLMTINGGKLYGPKQSGALFARAGIELRPIVAGGGQEAGLRSGTENVAFAVGLAAALDKAQVMRHKEAKRLQALQGVFFELIQELPAATINGSTRWRLPNNIHLTIPGQDNERLLLELEQAGVLAAAGSACSASDEMPSHVLKAIGLSDDEARASLRFSMGRQTSESDVRQVVEILAGLLSPKK